MIEPNITIHEGRAIAIKVAEIKETVQCLNKQFRELELFLHGKFKLEEE